MCFSGRCRNEILNGPSAGECRYNGRTPEGRCPIDENDDVETAADVDALVGDPLQRLYREQVEADKCPI